MIPVNSIICFKQDTKERKRVFKAASFAHPAKMLLGLQIYLIEHYTKTGDTILDPMAGSGTILMACTLGRNVVCVELEKKFVDMQKANWQKIKTLGPMMFCRMGEATILQGDARNLNGLLADNILFSPPYAETSGDIGKTPPKLVADLAKKYKRSSWIESTKSPYRDKAIPDNPNNISNLLYGEISAVISSPPYAEAQEGGGIAKKVYQGSKHSPTDLIGKRSYMPNQHGQTEGQIGNLPYGKADAVITSPPYEGAMDGGSRHTKGGIPQRELKMKRLGSYDTENKQNIGNLYTENYLQAMLQVYRECHKVLKENGLMVLVVKNFIRDKKIVRLDLDTIKICEKAGFKLKERLARKLTSQSFWRTIYHNKYPDVPKIEYEDVLIFQRAEGRPDGSL